MYHTYVMGIDNSIFRLEQQGFLFNKMKIIIRYLFQNQKLNYGKIL